MVDNQIYDNRQRGIEMYPDADRSLVENNVADANEDGVQFGGSLGSHSDSNRVVQNIVLQALGTGPIPSLGSADCARLSS